ncbi:MAG: bifunctional proline dehydrogenase/pyrroline-5-carboxylate dehydrogenase [Bacteroidetes bacterium ADurb.Bin408]|nr:MAG: bifunctional proline dehydrogenase/pyrroline-5-carboxylate dehydrogenase [Bacteroidetes bacterium ADurb.Bin408]
MEKERKRAADRGYPSPIYPDKPATDACFDGAVSLCLNNLDVVSFCMASHNETSNLLLTRQMEEMNLPFAHIGVSTAQLLGMSDNISFAMAHAGFNVAKYVPYGRVRTVIPYLLRRAAANTSVAGQTGRELAMIKTERARRKHLK